jgi:hypothetical protein
MGKRAILAKTFWLIVAAMFLAPPAAAQTDEAGFIAAMRQFADATAGQQVGSGRPADKVLYFGRNPGGEIIVTSIVALAPGAAWDSPPQDEHPLIAAMRCRGSSPANNSHPDPADIAYARTTGVPVFIVGEWQEPAIVWEVVWVDGQARTRAIDTEGHPGPWQIPAS